MEGPYRPDSAVHAAGPFQEGPEPDEPARHRGYREWLVVMLAALFVFVSYSISISNSYLISIVKTFEKLA